MEALFILLIYSYHSILLFYYPVVHKKYLINSKKGENGNGKWKLIPKPGNTAIFRASSPQPNPSHHNRIHPTTTKNPSHHNQKSIQPQPNRFFNNYLNKNNSKSGDNGNGNFKFITLVFLYGNV